MIEPALLTNLGTISGVYSRLGDLSRRLSTLESSRGLLNGIDGGSIAPGTIPGSAIVAGSITTASIAAGAITAELISAGAINTGHLQAGAVTAGIIAADAVTATHISAGSISTAALQAGSVTATAIAAGSIYAEALQAGSVTATAISANSIYTAAIQAGAVTADKVTVGTLASITANMGAITAGTITGATLQTSGSGSRVVMDSLGLRGYALDGITKVFEINAGSGVASFTGVANIDPLSVIPGGTITENTLPGDRIVAGTVATAQLAAGAVVANTIAAGAVTAQKLTVEWGGNNHLRNSSFEDSVAMSSWVAYMGFPHTPTVIAVSESPAGVVPQEGTKVCRVERLSAGTTGTYGAGTYGTATYGGTSTVPGHAGIYQGTVALPGRKYTMSAYAMIPTSKTAQVLRLYVDDGLAAGGYWASTTTYAIPNDGVWRRYTYTFDYVPNGSAANATGNLNVFYWMDDAVGGAFMYLDSVQFEPGDVPTAYSRRPGEILTGEVGATQITPNSITTNHIIAGTILGSDISATTITGSNIQAATITADKMNVTTLSAITANMGTIDAGTITGATVRTAASGTRILLDSAGFKQFLGSAVTPSIHFKTDGTDTNVFTGQISARGITFPEANSPGQAIASVNWDRAGSIRYAQATGGYTSPTSFARLTAGPDSSSAGTIARLDLATENSSKSTIFVQAYRAGAGFTEQILDNQGMSAYLRFPYGTADQYRLQHGQYEVSLGPGASPQEVQFTLGSAWTTNHAAFVTSALPVSSNTGFSLVSSGPLDLTKGNAVVINNSGITQLIRFTFISLGF